MKNRFNPLFVTIVLVLAVLGSIAIVLWHGSSSGLRKPGEASGPTTSAAKKKADEPKIPPINPKTDITVDEEGMRVVKGVLWIVWKKDTALTRRHALLKGIKVRGEIEEFNLSEIEVGDDGLIKTKGRLEKLPEVDTVMRAYLADPGFIPSDPDYQIAARQWPYLVGEAEQAWDISRGKGSQVAVIDTGFNLDHPDLKGALLRDKAVNFTTEKFNDRPDHGTHVSGIIGMRVNNIGLMGIAPESKIIPIKVDTFVQMADAVRLAASMKNVRTINMSMGINWWDINGKRAKEGKPPISEEVMTEWITEINKILMPAAEFAHQHDVAFVHSAGNDSMDFYYGLLDTDTVINVANIGKDDKLDDSSNFGAVTLGAPGQDIWSAVNGSKYDFMTGTSMAAPMVAGTVALIRTVNPKLTVDQVINILKDTARTTDCDVPCLNVWEALLDASNQYGVKGKVLDESGNPAVGVSVQPKGRSNLAVKTKEDGTFVISAIPRSNPVQLEIINDKGEPVLYDLGPIADDQFVMRDVQFQIERKQEAPPTTQVSQSSQAQLWFRANLPAQDEKDSSLKGYLLYDIGYTDLFSAGQISGGRKEHSSVDDHVYDMEYSGEVSELAVGGRVRLDISGFLPKSQSEDNQPVPVTMHLEGVISEKPGSAMNSRKIEITKLTVNPYTILYQRPGEVFAEYRTFHYEYDPQDFANSNGSYFLDFEIVFKS